MALKAVPSSLSALPSPLATVQRERRETGANGATRGKLYGARWQRERRLFLAFHPWCVYCAARGDRVKASVVDHIVPHRMNLERFHDPENRQPLCEEDHSKVKQALEERFGDDTDGLIEANGRLNGGWRCDPVWLDRFNRSAG